MNSKYGRNEAGDFVNLLTGNPPAQEELQLADRTSRAIIVAEEAFERALATKYGKRACDMRYRTKELPENIRTLALKYQQAVEDWRATWKME